MFTRRLGKSGLTIEGGYSFIGTAPAPEIAAYIRCITSADQQST
jgi:hypothetical protein